MKIYLLVVNPSYMVNSSKHPAILIGTWFESVMIITYNGYRDCTH